MKRFFILLTILLTAVFSLNADNIIEKRKGRTKTVKKIMTSMSDKQMIGQLFMVDSYSTFDSLQIKKVFRWIDSNYVGGVCFFKGNMKDLARMNEAYQRHSKIPLMTAIDGEWGMGMRMTDGKNIPMAMTMGALPADKRYLIYDAAENVAKQCKSLGIWVNFAPDADINVNPLNPVINMRSFGQNKNTVALCSEQYVNGLQSQGVMAVVKHFPGHGDTHTDSHKATPQIDHSKPFIDSVDAYPFAYTIKKGVWGVMTGHLQVASLSFDSLKPATVNGDITTDYLKGDLDFEGLVFTDAMNMKGVTNLYGKGESALMALTAGADIVLMPANVDSAVHSVLTALHEGKITRKFIKEKCRKVLNWKYDMGILTADCTFEVPNKSLTEANDDINYRIYENAITYVGNDMPQFNSPNDNYGDTVEVRGTKFASSSSYYGVSKSEFGRIKQFNDTVKGRKTLVIYGNAYILKYIDTSYNFDNVLVAYENNSLTRKAISRVLKGEVKPCGVLPVTAKKEHIAIEVPVDTVQSSVQNEYAPLAEMGIDTSAIRKIDSIANEGILQKAYPGCQVLIAHKGKIILDKNYGFLSYDSVKRVDDNTMYDIASVTKVMATTIALMKLYETGKVNLDAPIKKYLPEFKRCKFSSLTLKELLSHYTTLPATYPFWVKSFKDGNPDGRWYDYNVRMDENYMQVSDSLFIKKDYLNEMRNQLKDVKLKEKQYTYSDLNFLLLQYVIEAVTGQSLDSYVQKEFYNAMNLQNTCFNPLDKGFNKENIAPTEQEKTFRKQLICGTVHDPMAAMHGGVCGNAGLFSDAHDLYKICAMLLNNGELDGHRYLQESTVKAFNHRYFADKNIRRALGFDKPFISSQSTHCSKYASQSSYGHSGFTGTYFWNDPDNQTVFIFLSNRVHPSTSPNKLADMNIRTDIHDLIYQAVGM